MKKNIAALAVAAALSASVLPVYVSAAEKVGTVLDLELTFDTQPDITITYDDHRGKVDYKATLTNTDGEPIAGAKIYIGDSGDIAKGYVRQTDENGEITFKTYFPEGEYTVYTEFRGGEVNGVTYDASRDEEDIVLIDQKKPIIYDDDIRASRNNDGKVYNLDEYIEYVIGIPRGDSELLTPNGSTAEGLETPLAYFRYKAHTDGNVFYLTSEYQGIYVPRAKGTITPSLEGSPHTIWDDPEPFNFTTALGWDTATAFFYVYPEEGYEILPENIFVNKEDNGRTKYVGTIEYNAETGRLFLDHIETDVNLYVKATPAENAAAETIEVKTLKAAAAKSAAATFNLSSAAVLAAAVEEDDGAEKIATADDLVAFAEKVNNSTRNEQNNTINAKLVADIDLSGIGFTAIGKSGTYTTYNGTFDGQGHTISGLKIEGTTNQGLFGYTGSNANISNIVIKDSSVSGTGSVGALVGNSNSSTISNIKVENTTVTGTSSAVGGIVGQYAGSGKLSNVSIAASAVSSANARGVGQNYVGGIVGRATSTDIEGAYNLGAKVTGGTYVGGITGQAKTITKSFNAGEVNGDGNVGGVTGYIGSSNTVSDVYNTGKVTGDSATGNVGGIAGNNTNSSNAGNGVKNAVNSGEVINNSGEAHAITYNHSTNNTYYYAGTESEDSGATKITEADSGAEIAWKLNTTYNSGETGEAHDNSSVWTVVDGKPAFADDTNKAIYRVRFTEDGAEKLSYYTTASDNTVTDLPEQASEISTVDGTGGLVVKQLFDGWYNSGALVNKGDALSSDINAVPQYVKAVLNTNINYKKTAIIDTKPYLSYKIEVALPQTADKTRFEYGTLYAKGETIDGYAILAPADISEENKYSATIGEQSTIYEFTANIPVQAGTFKESYAVAPYAVFTDAYGSKNVISIGYVDNAVLYDLAEKEHDSNGTDAAYKKELETYILNASDTPAAEVSVKKDTSFSAEGAETNADAEVWTAKITGNGATVSGAVWTVSAEKDGVSKTLRKIVEKFPISTLEDNGSVVIGLIIAPNGGTIESVDVELN